MTYYPSYWERSIILRTFDFIVLGAGIIGKQIAIKIKTKYPDSRIALVDRSPISIGASTRNAGFACFGSISEIMDDLSRSSPQAVMELANKRYKGIQELLNSFGAKNIGFIPSGSTEIFTLEHSEELKKAKNGLNDINESLKKYTGLNTIFELKEDRSSGMNCHSTIITNKYEGMLNSGMLNETISNKAHNMGIIPFYGFNVSSIHKYNDGYELYNSDEMRITCNQLIIANNAFAGQFLPELDIVPARGQIIITKPISNIPFNGIFHSNKGYIYFRTIDNRILLGGARDLFATEEETFEFEGSEKVRLYLENYIRTIIMPGRAIETDMHWSGIMAMGKEKLPIVKRVDEHLLACVRMSGMGVALGPVLSDEIAAMI